MSSPSRRPCSFVLFYFRPDHDAGDGAQLSESEAASDRFVRWDWREEGAASCIFNGLATCAPLESCAIGDCIVVHREDGPSVRPKQAVIEALVRKGHSLQRAVEAVAFWGTGGVLADEALCGLWLAVRHTGR